MTAPALAYIAARDADETYLTARRMAINAYNTALGAAEGERSDVVYAMKVAAGGRLRRADMDAKIDFADRYAMAAIGTDLAYSARMAACEAIRAARLDNGKAILKHAIALREEALEAMRNKRKENTK